MTFWPFWLGAIALASVALGCLVLLRRPMGVSGNLAQALDPGARAAELEERTLTQEELRFALEQATRDAFADAEIREAMNAARPAKSQPALGAPLGWSVNVLFLIGIVLGAAVSGIFLGGASATIDVGPTYRALLGDGPRAWVMLFAGGTLVGFGTRMAAGCTSGHGLVGCGRFRPGSLVATACFFGVGIVLSFALVWVRR